MGEVDPKMETEEVNIKQASRSLSGKKRGVRRRRLPSLGDPEAPSKVIKIRHLPYGFFEQELLKYFRQFGRVRRIRVARSLKTGNFKGWAFVSFTDKDVAQVAAETMDGYLMFDKRLICKVLKNSEVPTCMRIGKCLKKPPIRGTRARKHTRLAGKRKSDLREEVREKRLLSRLNKKKEQLAAMGFNYSLVPGPPQHDLMKKEESAEEVSEGASKENKPKKATTKSRSAKKKKRTSQK